LNKTPEDLVPLGKVIKPHGLNGELKVFLYNSESKTFTKGLKVWFNIADQYRCYNLNSIKGSINNKIIQLKEISNIDETVNLVKKEIFVSRYDFAELDKDDKFYLSDLIGFKVIDENDNEYGKVIDILNTAASDIIIIDYKNKEIMIPAVDQYVALFDFENKLIKVNDIKSFIEL
jgi:16S rRNA processing protein RimM